ncbi:MAG TPA: FRG domain-containing protein [Bryobacteraceae bacterium]|nr:FRG domain-containing protein [Bryobacteraceae bacterium]
MPNKVRTAGPTAIPTGPPIYRQYRLESWDEFLKIITGSPYSNWAFRGHRKESWPLASALSRYFCNFHIDPRAWPQQEGRILRVFKRKAHQFLTQPPDPDDDFQWLALMQHHGAPTRLLDFTWSPYVAAFFALERATGDAAVWALNPANISAGGIRRFVTSNKPAVTTRGMDPRRKGNFARYFLRGDREFIWLGEPDTMNRRLIAQSGTFALPGVLNKPMEEIVHRYSDPKNMMAKFILPASKVRETGLRELYRMNITHATLFPDLDGLARSLAYELEFHWAYNPRTMESYVAEE